VGRRLGLAGRHGVSARRRRGARGEAAGLDAAGDSAPTTTSALLELLVRALGLERAAFLVDQGGILTPAATWGAVRPTPTRADAARSDGPWSARLPITCDGRPLGVALLARRGGRALAPAERGLAARLLDGVGRLLASASPDHEAARVGELLARAERLAVLGTLAAGIAHEIRNPLVSVRTFIELLPERLHDEEFRTEFRRLTLAEIERICDLLNDLLAFTRPAPAELEACDLNALAMQTVRLLEPEARKRRVTLRLALAHHPPSVLVDEGRMKQVLINLVLNGIEACDACGAVDVVTSSPTGDAWTVLDVADDGAGIPPDLANHVFDPFVTTKDGGSGLGLYVAHRIIGEHGGAIRVQPRPEGGTVFSVTLPAVAAARDAGTG
jgi:signal transduction histidine kinase